MESCVELRQLNLHYSSLAFKENSLKSQLFKIFSRNNHSLRAHIHALKNINLQIQAGERVAILGHNGAGKSTLLKTIAGLYPIASGYRYVKGRIRSLFELSLGFESEATGRENIMYRGLLLGKKPREIRKLEESIIEFAELGNFIDYPIKTYSSGMLVRLAFAISTLIEGEILLLDEILGAGDMGFMAKAKFRISQLIENSSILILATHDMNAAREFCTRAIILQAGALLFDGKVEAAISLYKQSMEIDLNYAT